MTPRDELRIAQNTYLSQVTSKLGVTLFEILPDLTTLRLPNDLTQVVFYAFRNILRKELVDAAHPTKTLEMVLHLVDNVVYTKVETQPNFLRFRFETHVRLPLVTLEPLKIGV